MRPFAATHESGSGTFATSRLRRAMSALEGNPEEICSGRVFLTLTHNGLEQDAIVVINRVVRGRVRTDHYRP
jgi:hypothetical protein